MKLIDRYILSSVLVPLSYCVLSFSMLFVVFDLFDNLADFLEAGTPLLMVIRFYLYLLPSAAVYIVPISMLLATLFSLSQMTRNNELTAMRASGLSLYRLVAPIMVLGLIASMFLAVIHEVIAPESAYWSEQFVRSQKKNDNALATQAHDLAYKNIDDQRVWLIGIYNFRDIHMQRIDLIQQREDGSDVFKLQAEEGLWKDNEWIFVNVAIQYYDPFGNPMGPPKYERQKLMTELTETPQDFLNEIKDPQYMSSRDLYGFIDRHDHLSESTLNRYRVDFHHRIAMPWTCLIITLLGIPFGSQTGRKGAVIGAALSIALFFSLYVFINFFLALGKKELLSPWFAAWTPNIIYLVIGSVMIRRMR